MEKTNVDINFEVTDANGKQILFERTRMASNLEPAELNALTAIAKKHLRAAKDAIEADALAAAQGRK